MGVFLSTPDFVEGIRDPATQEGTWKGAYVAGSNNGTLYSAVFDKNADYVKRPRNRKEIFDTIAAFREKGWKDMSPQDIKLTAGIPPDPPSKQRETGPIRQFY